LTKTTAPKTVLAAAPEKARTAQDRNKSRPSVRSTLCISFTVVFLMPNDRDNSPDNSKQSAVVGQSSSSRGYHFTQIIH
jgi:hypothetical protein